MRTSCDNFPHSIPVHLSDILVDQRLKEKLVAYSARGVAGTFLLATENRKADSRLFQQLSSRSSYLLVSFDQRTTATNP
jgi:hypothetical protein